MQNSPAVQDALSTFYQRFSAHDPDGFAAIIASGPGVSVIGSGPGEGHQGREPWISTYAEFITKAGLRLAGGKDPHGWAEGTVGFAVDEPRFVTPDGSFLPTRLTGVLHEEDGEWKVVHLHFSVGVPDEDALQPPDASE
jgi:hypothetical protein